MEGIQRLAGGLAAATVINALMPNYALGQQVSRTDDRIKATYETVPSPKGNGSIKGYLVRPISADTRSEKPTQLPGIIVVHENRGLNPHIEDIARRLALEGFLALAPDLLTLVGGTPPNEDAARDLHPKMNREHAIAASVAAVSFLQQHAESTGKVGAVGFCFGGGVVNRMATDSPDLAAGVAYYGVQPPSDKVPAIGAALLLHYAETDENVNKGIAAYEAALKANNKKYTIHSYPGTQHAFNNDTGAARYNKPAADLAWGRTIGIFKEQLGAPPRGA